MSKRTYANETMLVRAIVEALRDRGCYVRKIHGGPMQHAGLPDLYVLFAGRSIWLEVKQPSGHTSKLQEIEIQRLRRAGAVACVVTSVREAITAIHTHRSSDQRKLRARL